MTSPRLTGPGGGVGPVRLKRTLKAGRMGRRTNGKANKPISITASATRKLKASSRREKTTRTKRIGRRLRGRRKVARKGPEESRGKIPRMPAVGSLFTATLGARSAQAPTLQSRGAQPIPLGQQLRGDA